MTKVQFLVHKLRGYGTDDSPYKDWFLKFLGFKARHTNWKGAWSSGQPRPMMGKDWRMASDAEMREIIKQNMN